MSRVQYQATDFTVDSPSIFASEMMGEMIDYKLHSLYRDCAHVTEKLCKDEFGINRRRWLIIATLVEFEGVTVSHLAHRAELDVAQTSRAVGTLMREGFLRRFSNPEDARYAKLVLTDKGRDLYKALLERYRFANERLLDALTGDEINQLNELIQKLRKSATNLTIQRAAP